MSGILTLDNLNISLPFGLNYSSDSMVDASDKIAQQIMTEKMKALRNNIGNELFDQLSYDDRMLMAKTAGMIDFGRAVDLYNVGKEIENYDISW